MCLADFSLEAEMEKLERLLGQRHARDAERDAKFPVRRTAPHAAGKPLPVERPAVIHLSSEPHA